MNKERDSIMLAKMKNWLKNEDSQLSSENGMLIALAVIIVLVIGSLYGKQSKVVMIRSWHDSQKHQAMQT
jgi:hypothetical protein